MPALQKFLQAELHRRDWTIEEFVRKASLSVSRGYQIINEGQDNARQDTFARIAGALDMTPVELAARTGSGMGDLDAHDLEWLDVGRLIPLDQRPTWARMVRAATIEPAHPSRPSNGHRDGSSNSRPASRRALDRHESKQDETDAQGGLPTVYAYPRRVLAFAKSYVKQLLEPSNPRLAAQPAQ